MQEKSLDDTKYDVVIRDITSSIKSARYRSNLSVNKHLLILYFSIGRILDNRAIEEKWGSRILDRVSRDIQDDFPGIRGFSVRNMKKMRQFYREYSYLAIGPAVTAQIQPGSKLRRIQSQELTNESTPQVEMASILNPTCVTPKYMKTIVLSLGFTHHIILLNKCRDFEQRYFYMCEAVKNQWSSRVLEYYIDSNLFEQRGTIINNFKHTLPVEVKANAQEAFNDEYLFNFIAPKTVRSEIDIEKIIVRELERFMISLGDNFAYIGNQYRIVVDGEEFFIDLLFYHRVLHCMVAFDLKVGKVKPEYVGKMNFYLSALDEYVKHDDENPSIGIILCRHKSNTIVEFAFRKIGNPIGVATYQWGKELPENMKKYFPKPDQLDCFFDNG